MRKYRKKRKKTKYFINLATNADSDSSCHHRSSSRFPKVVITRTRVDPHRNVSNQSLTYNTPQQFQLEHRIVFPLRPKRVFENVQRVAPVTCTTKGMCDGVGGVWVHAVDAQVDFVVKEELASVGEVVGGEGTVG